MARSVPWWPMVARAAAGHNLLCVTPRISKPSRVVRALYFAISPCSSTSLSTSDRLLVFGRLRVLSALNIKKSTSQFQVCVIRSWQRAQDLIRSHRIPRTTTQRIKHPSDHPLLHRKTLMMSGEAWLYLLAVLLNAVNLFLQVFFTIMYSDLEWYVPNARSIGESNAKNIRPHPASGLEYLLSLFERDLVQPI